MLNVMEILLIILVVGGLALLQIRTRTGVMFPYLTVVFLLLMLVAATRIIRSLVGLVILLVLLCGVLLWRAVRQK